MTFEQFKQLVMGGETAYVDFKQMCNAFDTGKGDHERAKAELVKDICAMANNGSRTSYLIIGVADDKSHFQSVTNNKLTSANLQTLVRDSIHPRPKISVHDECWTKAPDPYRNKRFVIIQVGPHLKAAYRFNKDYIQPGSGYNFRKNQVWVRNSDTSDIATPEQILQLMSKRPVRVMESEPGFKNVDYQKLTRPEQPRIIYAELKDLFRELGYHIYPIPAKKESKLRWGFSEENDFRVVLTFYGKPFIMRCGVRMALQEARAQDVELANAWSLEHGVMRVLLGNMNKAARSFMAEVQFQAEWGWFSLFKIGTVGTRWSFAPPIPLGQGEAHMTFLTLPRITSTLQLRDAVTAMLAFVNSDAPTLMHIEQGRRELNSLLEKWSKSPVRELFRKNREIANDWHYEEDIKNFRKNLRSIQTLLSRGVGRG